MVRHHGALVAVQSDGSVVEWFLGVFDGVVQLRHTAFENTAEITRQQRPTDGCNKTTHRGLAFPYNKTIG